MVILSLVFLSPQRRADTCEPRYSVSLAWCPSRMLGIFVTYPDVAFDKLKSVMNLFGNKEDNMIKGLTEFILVLLD